MARRTQGPGTGRGTTVEIRPAREIDAPALARLGASLARLHHALDPDRFIAPEPLEPGYAWWLGKEILNPKAVVLAAYRRGRGAQRVVGYAYGRMEARDWNTLREACGVGIDLVVDPRARGKGIGEQLLEALVRRFAEKGARRVAIDVAWRNPRALRLFASLGFRRTMVEMTREIAPEAGRAPRRKGRGAAAGPQRASRGSRDVGS
jgi:ribosomal protein S18 acetylase RimI-like enzyme